MKNPNYLGVMVRNCHEGKQTFLFSFQSDFSQLLEKGGNN